MADYGWIVPEEAVFAALVAARQKMVAAVADDTVAEVVDTIYHNLTTAQKADITAWWSTRQPKLIHGWPVLEHQELPCIAVILDPESNSQQYLGEGMFQVVLSTGEHALVHGERWECNLAVIVHAENPDVVRWLYQWAKYELSSRRQALAATFRYRQQLSGRDFRPQAIGDSGRFVFMRALNFVGEYDQLDAVFDPVGDITNQLGVQNVLGQWP